MLSNLEKHRADLKALVELGDKLYLDLILRQADRNGELTPRQQEQWRALNGAFEQRYQNWFSESSAVIRQLLSSRHEEFEHLYRGDVRRKGVTALTFSIQDWLNGIRSATNEWTGKSYFDDLAGVAMRYNTQLQILKSAERRFESSLFEIRQLVQADLFDSELDAARELAKHGFARAAGAVAGVVLEKHLASVASDRSITIRKKNPAVNDFNDALKNGSIIDIPQWRQIQRLADLRNLCDHDRKRDLTSDEINELIEGVDRTSKTLF